MIKKIKFRHKERDIIVKWILLNTLGERTTRIGEGHRKTAHQIQTTLEKSFHQQFGEMKARLKGQEKQF